MLEYQDVILRLGSATLIGSLIGLNRDLHGKPTGVRTLGLVGLGSALIVLGVVNLATEGSADPNALSRVIQGVLTGIGFLGAGVIFHNSGSNPHDAFPRIQGLTTAACVWLTACAGMICGLGQWKLLVVALPLLLLVLIFGGPFEQAIHDRWGQADDNPPRT
jgi:putative Mg2+ transporter-C (MgtC) family protein